MKQYFFLLIASSFALVLALGGCATRPQSSSGAGGAQSSVLHLDRRVVSVDGTSVQGSKLVLPPGPHKLRARWEQAWRIHEGGLAGIIITGEPDHKRLPFDKEIHFDAKPGHRYALRWVMVHPTKAVAKLTPTERNSPTDPGTQSFLHPVSRSAYTFWSSAWPGKEIDNVWHGRMIESRHRLVVQDLTR